MNTIRLSDCRTEAEVETRVRAFIEQLAVDSIPRASADAEPPDSDFLSLDHYLPILADDVDRVVAEIMNTIRADFPGRPE